MFQQGCRLQKSRHQQRCSFNPEKQHASVVNNTTNNNTTNNTTNNNTTNNITINISVLPFGEEDMDSVIAAFSSSEGPAAAAVRLYASVVGVAWRRVSAAAPLGSEAPAGTAQAAAIASTVFQPIIRRLALGARCARRGGAGPATGRT